MPNGKRDSPHIHLLPVLDLEGDARYPRQASTCENDPQRTSRAMILVLARQQPFCWLASRRTKKPAFLRAFFWLPAAVSTAAEAKGDTRTTIAIPAVRSWRIVAVAVPIIWTIVAIAIVVAIAVMTMSVMTMPVARTDVRGLLRYSGSSFCLGSVIRGFGGRASE